MPVWLIIQGLLFIACIVAASIIYYTKLWKTAYPFSPRDIFKILLKFVFVSWFSSSIIYGFVYILNSEPKKTVPFLMLILIPFIALAIFTLYIIITINRQKIKLQDEQEAIKQKSKECDLWLKNFPFINPDKVEVKIYISNGKPVGRLIIHELTLDQATIVENQKTNVPKNIYLVVETFNHTPPSIYH